MKQHKDGAYDYKQIDKLLHSPIRLSVMSLLASAEEAEFTYIRGEVGASDGNLTTHLRKLENEEYIEVEKIFRDRKPLTIYKITQKGIEALERYVEHLESLVKK
ncbi:MAG: transcriptional regulator [Spirochaetes bacterium]|jgi:DNA-binding MarR family transcriptional regulator|nr:transcriptional regulator [Spirochaetota bacterium]